jgi:hypothetical protein
MNNHMIVTHKTLILSEIIIIIINMNGKRHQTIVRPEEKECMNHNNDGDRKI